MLCVVKTKYNVTKMSNGTEEKIKIAVSDFEKRNGKILYAYAIDMKNPPSNKPGQEYSSIKGLKRKDNEGVKDFVKYILAQINELNKEIGDGVVESVAFLFIAENGYPLRYDLQYAAPTTT